ncbi:MAG: sigma-54 dependent transcriptional regulator [Bacteroidota bacterium]
MSKPTLNHIKNTIGIIGNDKMLNRAIEIAMQVASTKMSVLISGENGTGKESFSKIIHSLSSYKHKKLVPINCGSIPEGTIDSELFGHEKGAFTGAVETRKGYFEEADGGTIFLDEIGEMPLSTQARLLRVLEYGEFIKVGSSKVQKTYPRIIAATNVNLLEAVRKGKFRQDLYYRINTVTIQVPPLRKRGDDILLLFKKFANDFADIHVTQPIKLDPEAAHTLLSYTFPGNVRQLKNLVNQMAVLEYQHPLIDAQTLATYLPAHSQALLTVAPHDTLNPQISPAEREILYKVLFEMQKDLQDLKRLLFEKLQKEEEGKDLIDAYPVLFNRLREPNTIAGNFPKTHTPPAPIANKNPLPLAKFLTKENIEVPSQEENLRLIDKEKELIQKALRKHDYKRKYAAKSLGIAERTLYRKIKEYDL